MLNISTTKYQSYLDYINIGFTTKSDLDDFIYHIAEDITISYLQYSFLRRKAIDKFYNYYI